MADLVIVSMHENGFPVADMYREAAEISGDELELMGLVPDCFFTMGRGDSIEAAYSKATLTWPGAKIVYAADEDETNDASA